MGETADRKSRLTARVLVALAVAAVLVIAASAHLPVLVRYRREHAAARTYEAMGGACLWRPGSPPWPLSLLGRRYSKLYDQLYSIVLNRSTGVVTDEGLVHLKGLSRLKRLNLYNTQVTDAGLANLKGVTQLQQLYLSNTRVTDAGLVHLEGLSRLLVLHLSSTQVTDAGLVHLKGLSRLVELDLAGTRVTDAGLVHLKGFSELWHLHLNGTQVTDAGVAGLKAVLPKLTVNR